MLQAFDPLPFGVDHIRPQYHGGATIADNLAFACFDCNTYKGTNIAGYDPEDDSIHVLFNPRTDSWDDHFTWSGPRLTGLTPIGRVTVDVLRINLPDRVEHRRLLIREGVFP